MFTSKNHAIRQPIVKTFFLHYLINADFFSSVNWMIAVVNVSVRLWIELSISHPHCWSVEGQKEANWFGRSNDIWSNRFKCITSCWCCFPRFFQACFSSKNKLVSGRARDFLSLFSDISAVIIFITCYTYWEGNSISVSMIHSSTGTHLCSTSVFLSYHLWHNLIRTITTTIAVLEYCVCFFIQSEIFSQCEKIWLKDSTTGLLIKVTIEPVPDNFFRLLFLGFYWTIRSYNWTRAENDWKLAVHRFIWYNSMIYIIALRNLSFIREHWVPINKCMPPYYHHMNW